MTIVYPRGPITPHGRYHLLKGDWPEVSLRSDNGQIIFRLMGGQSLPERFERPECVRVLDLQGLIPPWMLIEQEGANQDGTTVVDALYEPTDIALKVLISARDAKMKRRVQRHLEEVLDAKRQCEFGWTTHELGYWWAPLRWKNKPPDKYDGSDTEQELTLFLQGDNAFYQSFPDVDEFEFQYEDMIDTFKVDYSEDQNLGPNWPQHYTGVGDGFHYANGDHAKWNDDPKSYFFNGTGRVVCGPYEDYNTPYDIQEISITIDNTPEYAPGAGAAMDIWGRMGRNEDGTWNGYGVRARFGWGYVRLSYFLDFEEHVLWQNLQFIAPLAGETFTLRCGIGGINGNARRFQLLRGNNSVLTYNEIGTNSPLGEQYRGVGFGLQAGAALLSQATPARIREWVGGGASDTFSGTTTEGLGENWPLYYEVNNDAYVHIDDGNATWVDNAATESQEVVNGPYKDFETETDNQIVSMVLGSFPEWSAPETGANDLWGRMGRDGSGDWDGNGIRLRCTRAYFYLSAFVDFEEVWTRRVRNTFLPFPGDKWQLACGFPDEPRTFKVYRNGGTVLEFKEVGEASMLGADYRGVGFGVRAGGALITQATPAIVRKVAAGDNAEVTQTGYLNRRNAGDQPAYDTITVYGPATRVDIADGPDSDEMVEIHDLKAGEVVVIRTDPRRGGIFDPFANQDTAPALFGANPSDTMYRKLKGRFTANCAIPPKEPGMRVRTHKVKVAITGGNADSRITASLTPLRRSPE